jgi:hypothetical protein
MGADVSVVNREQETSPGSSRRPVSALAHSHPASGGFSTNRGKKASGVLHGQVVPCVSVNLAFTLISFGMLVNHAWIGPSTGSPLTRTSTREPCRVRACRH